MPTYIPKPVKVEAMQYTGDIFELKRWVNRITNGMFEIKCSPGPNNVEVTIITDNKMETIIASIRDYVVRGIRGEFFILNEAMFKETYQLVERFY